MSFLWPYNVPFIEFAKKGGLTVSGVILGAYLMNKVYHPMEGIHDRYNSAKLHLLVSYNQMYDEYQVRELERRSDLASMESAPAKT